MKLPRFAARWADKQIDAAWDQHTAHCLEYGKDPHDIDPPDNWRNNLHIWFPEANWLQRSIDWNEIRGSVSGPIHRGLRLCKLGLHSWTGFYEGRRERRYQDSYAICTSCGDKKYGHVPRWAR